MDHHSGTWVTFVAGRATGLSVRRCRLHVIDGPDSGTVREYAQELIRIGALDPADLCLKDQKVSGIHCEIRLDADGFRLRDLGSTNGTFVEGLRISDVFLNAGTVISAGDTRLRFDPLASSLELPLSTAEGFGSVVGRSPLMRGLFARLAKAAASDATVLLTGETGTGKDVVAEAIHEESPRNTGPFVVLDCGAMAPNLIESEIFGHERGAFTGATSTYAGAFERADGGTLFLDEIGELPLDLQPKLLRLLERREIRRLGGSKSINVNVRVVAATNRDLAIEVNRGRFREDLYYRLAVAHFHLPALRERAEDIPLLVEHFLKQLPGGESVSLQPATIAAMMKHRWPGNVRELRNVMERAVFLGEEPPAASVRREQISAVAQPVDVSVPFKAAKQRVIDEFERQYVTQLLEAHGNNFSAAARAAGVDRMTLHKIAERLGIRDGSKRG